MSPWRTSLREVLGRYTTYHCASLVVCTVRGKEKMKGRSSSFACRPSMPPGMRWREWGTLSSFYGIVSQDFYVGGHQTDQATGELQGVRESRYVQ